MLFMHIYESLDACVLNCVVFNAMRSTVTRRFHMEILLKKPQLQYILLISIFTVKYVRQLKNGTTISKLVAKSVRIQWLANARIWIQWLADVRVQRAWLAN